MRPESGIKILEWRRRCEIRIGEVPDELGKFGNIEDSGYKWDWKMTWVGGEDRGGIREAGRDVEQRTEEYRRAGDPREYTIREDEEIWSSRTGKMETKGYRE